MSNYYQAIFCLVKIEYYAVFLVCFVRKNKSLLTYYEVFFIIKNNTSNNADSVMLISKYEEDYDKKTFIPIAWNIYYDK